MSDTVYRDAALEAVSSEPLYESGLKKRYAEDVVPAIYEKIKALKPTEPEIIRCKDCVYLTPEKSGKHWNICRFYDAPKTADGFCNDAERKEE